MICKHKKPIKIGILILIVLCPIYYVLRAPSPRLYKYLAPGSKWSATNINYTFTIRNNDYNCYSNYTDYSEDDVDCKLTILFRPNNAIYLPVEFCKEKPITLDDGSYYYENNIIQYYTEECLCDGTAFISKNTIIVIVKNNNLFPSNIRYIKFKRIE